jgi:hypothetical protein
MKFFFEPIPAVSLSNLCEMFDNEYQEDGTRFLNPSMIMDIATEVLDITTDGNHCGTLVGARWFLEQMCEENVSWFAHEGHDYDRAKWIAVWTTIHDEFLDKHDWDKFYYVNLTD